jgi:hypothetical protein
MMEFSIINDTGHTEVKFYDDHVIVQWEKTKGHERDMLCKMLNDARDAGCETFTVNDDDEPVKFTEKVPGMIFNRKGKLMVKPPERNEEEKNDGKKAITVAWIAKQFINAEIGVGYSMIMEAQEDNSWKILKVGEFEMKKGKEKQVVVAKTKVVGG